MCRCYLQKVRVIGRKSSGLSERKKERLSDKEKSKLYHAHILRWDDSRYLKTEGLRGCSFFCWGYHHDGLRWACSQSVNTYRYF